MRWIASKLATMIFLEGTWIVRNPVLDRQAITSAPDETLAALLSFYRLPRQVEEGLDKLVSYGINFQDAVELHESLTESGLLVEEDKEEPWASLVEAADGDFAEVLRYLSMRHIVQHHDYSDPLIFKKDAAIMQTYLEAELPPPIYKRYEGLPVLPLAHPATGPAEDLLSRLGHLLFWSFGRLRDATFLNLLPAILKPVPSKGARHPFEAYFSTDGFLGIEPGLYHYDVFQHRLEFLAPICIARETGNEILVCGVYDRIQWRYRYSWAYKDLFFDLGHIQANLDIVAHFLKLTLRPSHVPAGLPGLSELIEEPLAAYQVLEWQNRESEENQGVMRDNP